MQDLGGYLTLEDLKHYMKAGSQDTEAISLKFTGQDITQRQAAGTEDGPN